MAKVLSVVVKSAFIAGTILAAGSAAAAEAAIWPQANSKFVVDPIVSIKAATLPRSC